MKRAPRSLQHHVLYRKYNGQDSEISALLGKCGLNTHFRKIMREQENKDLVLIEAQKDLIENPPSVDIDGEIGEDFFVRFEPFAESASTVEIRQLFGRILAGEVRRPGSVSAATLHFASMLDNETASLIDRVLPYCDVSGMAFTSLMKHQLSVSEQFHLSNVGFWTTGTQLDLDTGSSGRRSLRIEKHAVISWVSEKSLGSIGPTSLLSPASLGLAHILDVPFVWAEFAKLLVARGADSATYYFFKMAEGKEELDWGRFYSSEHPDGVYFGG